MNSEPKSDQVNAAKTPEADGQVNAHDARPAGSPQMLYFGPWDQAGHYFFNEHGGAGHVYSQSGQAVMRAEKEVPWKPGEIDGGLQPHYSDCKRRDRAIGYCGCTSSKEGVALLHHRSGWTALSFWDRSVDTRGACNSTYFAKGTFAFDEMVSMAQARFSKRWAKMNFSVVPMATTQD